MTGQRVEVLLLSYRSRPTSATMAVNGMVHYSRKHGTEVDVLLLGNHSLVHRARNEALASSKPDASHVLLLDDDMVPLPDTLERLLAHDVPAVSALCTTREPPIRLAVHAYREELDLFAPMHHMRPGKLHTGKFGVGAAFLLLKREVVTSLVEDYLSANDWLSDNRRTFDRLHVRAENREKERARREEVRRGRWAGQNYLRVFFYYISDDEVEFGEDMTMSRKLIRLGVPMSIDPDCVVGHLGEYPYTPDDVDYAAYSPEQAKADKELVLGAVPAMPPYTGEQLAAIGEQAKQVLGPA